MFLHAYGKKGDIDSAEQWMHHMINKGIQPTEVSFNALINACAYAWDPERAEHWLNTMKEAGIQPSAGTYNALIWVCAKIATDANTQPIDSRRSFSEAERWFAQMTKEGIEPVLASYTPLICAALKLQDTKHAEAGLRRCWHLALSSTSHRSRL